MLKKIVLSFLILPFFSCSFGKPVISELSVKRLVVENKNSLIEERLSVFLLYYDEDGRNDYNEITVFHNGSGLFWKLNRHNSDFFISDKLLKSESKAKEKQWIGSNKLVFPLGKILLGEYKIIAEDLAGNRSIKTFSFQDNIDASGLPFSFIVENNTWKLKLLQYQQFKDYSLILLGADKQPIFVEQGIADTENISGNLDRLKKDYSDSRYIQCMVENSDNTVAYLSLAYKLY